MTVEARDIAISVLPASKANNEIIAVARNLTEAAEKTEDTMAAQQMLHAVEGLLRASGRLTEALEGIGKALKAD